MSSSEQTKIIFLDVDFPPLAIVQDTAWQQQIASSQIIRRFFSQNLIEAVSTGRPTAADKVLELLSHWISFLGDHEAVQHTYALRMKLDAFLYSYAIEHQQLDRFVWHTLGICSTGRQVALRLDPTLRLNAQAAWHLYTLRDWISVGETEHFRCHIGDARPGFWVSLRYSDLQKNVFRFVISGGYLWPSSFPVIDSDALTVLTTRQGHSTVSAIETLVS